MLREFKRLHCLTACSRGGTRPGCSGLIKRDHKNPPMMGIVYLLWANLPTAILSSQWNFLNLYPVWLSLAQLLVMTLARSFMNPTYSRAPNRMQHSSGALLSATWRGIIPSFNILNALVFPFTVTTNGSGGPFCCPRAAGSPAPPWPLPQSCFRPTVLWLHIAARHYSFSGITGILAIGWE